jgi:hypothetical protein
MNGCICVKHEFLRSSLWHLVRYLIQDWFFNSVGTADAPNPDTSFDQVNVTSLNHRIELNLAKAQLFQFGTHSNRSDDSL